MPFGRRRGIRCVSSSPIRYNGNMITQVMQKGRLANRIPAESAPGASERFRFRIPRIAERIISFRLFHPADGPPFAPLPAASCDDLRHILTAYQRRPADLSPEQKTNKRTMHRLLNILYQDYSICGSQVS